MIDKENAIKNLIDLDSIFRKNKVRYWIQDGTLLGYYRDSDFISYDNDVDIGIKWSDFTCNTMIDVINNGFTLYATSGLLEDSLVINIIKRGVSVDLYFYYPKDNYYFYHTAVVKKPYADGRRRIDFTYMNFDVREIEFLGSKFFAPHNIEYFLETKYGKDWKTPDTEWISSVSPLNRTLTTVSISKKRSRLEFTEWLNMQCAVRLIK